MNEEQSIKRDGLRRRQKPKATAETKHLLIFCDIIAMYVGKKKVRSPYPTSDTNLSTRTPTRANSQVGIQTRRILRGVSKRSSKERQNRSQPTVNAKY